MQLALVGRQEMDCVSPEGPVLMKLMESAGRGEEACTPQEGLGGAVGSACPRARKELLARAQICQHEELSESNV